MTRWRDMPLPIIEEARRLEAARRIRDGEVTFEFICGHCASASVVGERLGVLTCLACSRETTLQTAHTMRQQRMVAYIAKGVDIDVTTHTPQED